MNNLRQSLLACGILFLLLLSSTSASHRPGHARPLIVILTSISPSSTPAGGPAFMLTAVGTSFKQGDTVRWNGNARVTTFESKSRLTAAITAADIAAPGSVQVWVENPSGRKSNELTFTILPISGGNDCTTTVNPDHTSVSNAVTAAADGNTICVNAGSATWTSGLTYSKWLRLIALGTVTITDNSAGGEGVSLITITESALGNSRFEGFTIVQGTGVHTGTGGIIKMIGGGKPILITGNTFTQGTTGNAIVSQTNSGVIWGNTFTGTRSGGSCLNNTSALRHKSTGLGSSWTTASTFGTADTNGTSHLYFETNTINNVAEAIDTDDNGRTVVRYNSLTNSGTTLHGVDTSGIYGARYVEFYQNTWIEDLTPIAACGNEPANVDSYIHVRGGTALIHNNVIPDPSSPTWGTKFAVKFSVEELRRNGGGFPCWDTTTAPGSGYPAPHNAGWGYISGATTVTGSNCANCPVNQDIEPIYLWSNSGGGNYDTPALLDFAPNECGAGAPSVTTYIQSGRDYFTSTSKPSYTAYAYPHPLTLNGAAPSALPPGGFSN